MAANVAQFAGHCEVGDWAIVGGLVGVHQFCRIGTHCMIGFGYRVAMDVPPYLLAGGEPLKPSGVNKIGLSRRGFSEQTIGDIQKAYRILYRSNLTLSRALDQIRGEFPNSAEIGRIVEFVEKSERGIIR